MSSMPEGGHGSRMITRLACPFLPDGPGQRLRHHSVWLGGCPLLCATAFASCGCRWAVRAHVPGLLPWASLHTVPASR